jgi:SAM-dependent methyltransferase
MLGIKFEMNFTKQEHYNKKANLQKIIAEDLIQFAKPTLQNTNSILDVGCGTGFVAQELLKYCNPSTLDGLDPSRLMIEIAQPYYTSLFNIRLEDFKPLRQYDVILSSMSFQWISNLEENITKLRQIGDLYFAMPITGSLKELNDAFHKSGITSPILNFKNPSYAPSLVLEYRECFDNLLSVLKFFNAIGAKNLEATSITHNHIKLAEANFKGKITWKIGFFCLKK